MKIKVFVQEETGFEIEVEEYDKVEDLLSKASVLKGAKLKLSDAYISTRGWSITNSFLESGIKDGESVPLVYEDDEKEVYVETEMAPPLDTQTPIFNEIPKPTIGKPPKTRPQTAMTGGNK